VEIRGQPVSALISFYPFAHRYALPPKLTPKLVKPPKLWKTPKIPIRTRLIFSLQSGMLVSLNPVKLRQRSRKAPASNRGFFYSLFARNPFKKTNLPVTHLERRIYRHHFW
jgi:hypothetical protein